MRHAYLILAHASDMVFTTLLRCLDDERNDIYIHMDAKNVAYSATETAQIVTKAGLFHVERHDCRWADYSLVEAELTLLEAATHQNHYDYYHLLSGADLPIKSQQYIHDFFDKNSGKEFVRFQSPEFLFLDRVSYYYPFLRQLGRKYKVLRHLTVPFQKILRIKRPCNYVALPSGEGTGMRLFQKGTQWFSITDSFARYVVSKRDEIDQTFRGAYISDELFLQTILINSPYKDNLYHPAFDNSLDAIQRIIDWTRGAPYTFRITDLDELKSSPYLFARKFDARIDSDIVRAIDHLLRNN